MTLRLRNICSNDLEMIINWRMLPEVTKYMYTDPQLTLESQIKWFNSIKDNETAKYWIVECDNTDIGVLNLCEIDYINKRCSWAYYIADTSFRGRGIATLLECNMYDYVFNKLGLNKLCCEVFEFNDKVIQIHQKFGSEVEGILKEHIIKNGVRHNVVTMGILKSRWEQIRQQYNYEIIEIQ